MNVDIKYGPCNTVAKISLETGEQITAEAGSMVAMSGTLDINTTTHKKGKGSLFKSIGRLLTGESFFLNHYTAKQQGEIYISQRLSGDIAIHQMENQNLIVQAGSFLAAEDDVELNPGWQGFKNFLSGEGFFWIKMSGQGQLLLSSFGQIYEIDVEDEYVVDTGHIVAFEESLRFDISRPTKSWMTTFLSGEGFVCRFKGKGKLYCQSHHPKEFGRSLTPYLRPKKR